MTVATESLKSAVASRLWSEPYGSNSEMVSTPWDFPDGQTIALLVRDDGEGRFFVSDQGATADRLITSGVHLQSGRARGSWELVKRGLQAVLVEPPHWAELALTTDKAGLGAALMEISSRALQADGLHVLARAQKPHKYADQALREATAHYVDVHPGAEIPNRFGGKRKVSFRASNDSGNLAWVMALGDGASFLEDHDRAQLVFRDAATTGAKIIALSPNASPRPWHLQSLAEVGTVIDGRDMGDYWTDFAAA